MKKQLNKSKQLENGSSPVRCLQIHVPTSNGEIPEEVYYLEEGTPPYRVHMALWDWDDEKEQAILHRISHKVDSIEEGERLFAFGRYMAESFDGLLAMIGILPADRHVILTCKEPMAAVTINFFPIEDNRTGKEDQLR